QTRNPLERYNQKVADLNSLLQKTGMTQDTYRRRLSQLRGEYEAASNAGEKAFGSRAMFMVKNLAGALGVGAGLAGVLAAVRAEYQHLIEVQREAAGISKTVTEVQETALTNLGAETPAERDAFIARVKAIAKERRVGEKEVYARASDALSARGTMSVDQAMGAVSASFLFAPGNAGAGQAGAGAALDIGRITNWTPEQALGYMLAVGSKARVTDPQKLAMNLAPALTAGMTNQGTPETSGALWAALTQGMADPTGERSRTAMISLVNQLREQVPEEKTLSGRIALLQRDEARRQEFLDAATFEQAAKAPVRELLGGGQTAAAYAEFRRDLPAGDEASQLFLRRVEVREAAELQRTAAFDRQVQGTVEGLASLDQTRARLGILRDKFGPILRQSGQNAIETRMNQLIVDLHGGDLGDFANEIDRQARRLSDPLRETRESIGGYRLFPGSGYAALADAERRQATAPSPSQSEQVELLRELATSLRNIEQNTRDTAESSNRAAARPLASPAVNHRDHQ
ncbi:MAG: hypothetical protein JW888_15165, partial [Pirellulales bacterium]|nr:hypothetical protein [Pirellulales bacterium]